MPNLENLNIQNSLIKFLDIRQHIHIKLVELSVWQTIAMRCCITIKYDEYET